MEATQDVQARLGKTERGAGGDRPGRRQVVGWSLAAGVALAFAWSYHLVDEVIGATVADRVLGYDARTGPIEGSLAGALFAFVAGVAGTFTACNIAAFSALAPLSGRDPGPSGGRSRTWRAPLVGLGWLTLAACLVSGAYGAVGVLLADHLPQLSTATTGGGMPVRLLQSVVVFTAIGLVLVWLGLAELGLVPDPLRRLRARLPQAPLLVIGALIGAFLVGRPYGLFFRLFRYAAETGNPLFGATAFVLQTLGNLLLIAVLVLAVHALTRGRFAGWLLARPGRAQTVTAAALLVAGVFTAVYWGVRVPSLFGWWGGLFPTAPWNS